MKSTELAPQYIVTLGEFVVKKQKTALADQNKTISETARIILITLLDHYGTVKSHTTEIDGKTSALVLIMFDSSQNITIYATMKYMNGRRLDIAIVDQNFKKLTNYDKLRNAVRVAETVSFLHSFKLTLRFDLYKYHDL